MICRSGARGGRTNWLTIRFAASAARSPSRRRSILTSITTVLLPTCRGSATATISSPSSPAAKTLSFSSIVVKLWPGGMLRKVAQAATVSPSAVQTPPWTKPPGCRWRWSTTIRPREWVSSTSSGSIPRSPGKLPGRKARTLSGVIAELGAAPPRSSARHPTRRRSPPARGRRRARRARAPPRGSRTRRRGGRSRGPPRCGGRCRRRRCRAAGSGAGPARRAIWLTSSFIITSWLIGIRATRSSSRSKRSSSSLRRGRLGRQPPLRRLGAGQRVAGQQQPLGPHRADPLRPHRRRRRAPDARRRVADLGVLGDHQQVRAERHVGAAGDAVAVDLAEHRLLGVEEAHEAAHVARHELVVGDRVPVRLRRVVGADHRRVERRARRAPRRHPARSCRPRPRRPGRSRRRSRCRCRPARSRGPRGRGWPARRRRRSRAGIRGVIPLPRSGRFRVMRATRSSVS